MLLGRALPYCFLPLYLNFQFANLREQEQKGHQNVGKEAKGILHLPIVVMDENSMGFREIWKIVMNLVCNRSNDWREGFQFIPLAAIRIRVLSRTLVLAVSGELVHFRTDELSNVDLIYFYGNCYGG